MRSVMYRLLEHPSEFQSVVDIQNRVWFATVSDAVPTHMLRAITKNGGMVAGAEVDGSLVGFTFGFPSTREGGRLLWSHMAAVLPEYQGRGIGAGLKYFQRDWARDAAFSSIGWTFDPMRRMNAYFNLQRLRAMGIVYHENYYGQMQDALNAGIPSDRLEIRWSTTDSEPVPEVAADTLPFWLFLSREGELRHREPDLSSGDALVQIPDDAAVLWRENPELANQWVLALRHVMQQALGEGFVVRDFISGNGWGAYRLTQQV